MLLEKFFDEHYRPRRLLNKSPETTRLYRFSIRSFGKTLERPAKLVDLMHGNVVAHMQRVIDNGRSPATANKDRAQLLALWRFAFRLKMHDTWPDVEELKEPERVPRAWLREEVAQLLAAARAMPGDFCEIPRSVWWEAMILVCLDTGERIGAVRPARWSWLSDGWITMPAEERKGGRRDKCYRLSTGTVSKLRELQKWAPGHKQIFPWPYCHHYFWALYSQVLEKAGLPSERRDKTHKLRKTTASVVHAAGMDAQAALDHSSKAITRAYLDPRVADRGAQQPCDALADYLRNPPPPPTDRKTG